MRENSEPTERSAESVPQRDRRSFMAWVGSFALIGALVTAYGSFAAILGRYLYPARKSRQYWLFVREVANLPESGAFAYQLPNGAPVNITRRGESGEFIALSSTCPHLGCQVHWEGQNDRFFCPCHNGVFSPDGEPVSGPPADSGQTLPQYPLKVESGLLFIGASEEQLT